MEIKRVYSSFGQLATEICVSEVKLNFENFQQQSKIISQKISVPEIEAIWWIELRPYGLQTTFAQASAPPQMIIVFEFQNPELCKSQLFNATVNVTATNVASYGMIFKDYKRVINAEYIEIDTKSNEYQSSLSRSMTNNAYYFQELYRKNQSATSSNYNATCYNAGYINNYNSSTTRSTTSSNPGYSVPLTNPWKSLTSLSFDCSVVFNYLGNPGCKNYSETVKGLPKIYNELNRQRIASLFDDKTFSDFTFLVKGKSFKVHKNLLSLASDVFKTMFTCGLDETKKNTANVDCDPEIFRHFLTYIYKADLPLQKMPMISFDLYELAHLYDVEELKKICLNFILDTKITIDNALKLYKFATTYEIAQLLDTSWEFIKIKMLKIFDECEPRPVEKVLEMLEEKKKFEDFKKTFVGEKRASEKDKQNVTEKEIGMPQKKRTRKIRK